MFDDEMLTIEDVAAYLKLKPQTIYKWAQTGKIPGAKFGKEWRFRRSAIEQWIDRQISSQAGNAEGSGRVGSSDNTSRPSGGTGRVNRTAGGETMESSSSKPRPTRVRKDGGGPGKN